MSEGSKKLFQHKKMPSCKRAAETAGDFRPKQVNPLTKAVWCA